VRKRSKELRFDRAAKGPRARDTCAHYRDFCLL